MQQCYRFDVRQILPALCSLFVVNQSLVFFSKILIVLVFNSKYKQFIFRVYVKFIPVCLTNDI